MFIKNEKYESLVRENTEMRIKIEMLEKMLAEKPPVIEKIVEKPVEKIVEKVVYRDAPASTLKHEKPQGRKRPTSVVQSGKIFYNGNTSEFFTMGEAEPGHGPYKRYSIDVWCCGHHMLGNYYHEPDPKADNRMGWAYLRDSSEKNDIPGWSTYYAKIVDACRANVEGKKFAADIDLDNNELPFT